jgi:hypothetical protein
MQKSFIKAFVLIASSICGLLSYSAIAVNQKPLRDDLLRDVRNMRGSILFIDTQNHVDITSGLDSAIKALDAEFHFDIRRTELNEKITPANVFTLQHKLKASVAIFITENNEMPSIVTCPDAHIAIVNILPLVKGCSNVARRNKRIRCEMLRAFAFAFGAGFSQYGALLMSPMDTAIDREVIPSKTFLPFDTVIVIRKIANSRGITPYKIEFYETAYREGWAPPPANDVQRAIIEQVKADKERGPTNPIKIPMPKRK